MLYTNGKVKVIVERRKMVIDEGLAAQAVFLKMWEGMSWETQMKMLGLVRDPNGCFLNIC